MSIDCHVHLFKKNQAKIANPRHLPHYDATLTDLKQFADPVGVTRFVLVQTSFMGTNNDLLLNHLRSDSERLRGVFILNADTTKSELRDLKSQGVTGIRLNLFGTTLRESLDAQQLALVQRCSDEGLSVGLHDDASRLMQILDLIGTRANRLVIDHFGRPESLPLAEQDPAYDRLIDRMCQLACYVKISAPYRSPNMNAQKAFDKLHTKIGADHLLWASDWPWTQHENELTYSDWASKLTISGAQTNLPKQFEANAKNFYGFD